MKKNIILVALMALLITSFNGCGNSNNNNEQIDIVEYVEKNDMLKNIMYVSHDSRYPEETKSFFSDTVVVKENLITHEVFGQPNAIVEIRENDLNLTDILNSVNYSVKRKVSVGEEISSFTINRTINPGVVIEVNLTETCYLDEKLNNLNITTKESNLTYEGDIIAQVCTSDVTELYPALNETSKHIDIEYTYYEKDKGRIALVNKNCYVPHTNSNPDNNTTSYDIQDKSEECSFTVSKYELLLE